MRRCGSTTTSRLRERRVAGRCGRAAFRAKRETNANEKRRPQGRLFHFQGRGQEFNIESTEKRNWRAKRAEIISVISVLNPTLGRFGGHCLGIRCFPFTRATIIPRSV